MMIAKPQFELNRSDSGGKPNYHKYLEDPRSVQVKYRPVAQLDTLPPIPSPDDNVSEAALWWRDQWIRSTEGWTAPDGVWLNPILYWYLNFVKVETVNNRGQEIKENPLYSDADHETFDAIYFSLAHNIQQEIFLKGRRRIDRKNKKAALKAMKDEEREFVRQYQDIPLRAQDLIATKGRRKHWSYNNLCGVFLWAFCVKQNGNLGIGFDCKDSREEGQRIFRGAYDRLHDFWKHEAFYTDREGELTAMERYVDGNGEVKEREGTVVFFKEVDKRFGAFRGKRFWLVLFDEAGKYTNLTKLIGATRDCLRLGTQKWGTMLIGGTCDPVTNKSTDYQKLWERAERLGMNRLFIPAWKLAPGQNDERDSDPQMNWFTGISNEKKARAEYQHDRDVFLDAGDMQGYHITVQENPLDIHELFMLPTLSSYSPFMLMNNTQRLAEMGEALPVKRGRLEWAVNTSGRRLDQVFFQEDPNGNWLMHSDYQPMAQYEDLDVIGIDSVAKDIVVDSDSQCSVVLYRRFHHKLEQSDMPMMVYFARPLLDEFLDEIKKIAIWTRCRILLEHNDKWLADELIKTKIKSDSGNVVTLTERLMYYNGEPGLRNSENSIATQTVLTSNWIRDGGLNRNYFQIIIDALKNWRQKNDDVASAFHLCMMAIDTLQSDVIQRDDSRAMVPDFRFLASELFSVASTFNAIADGWDGESDLAPVGMSNGAWGNPLRSRQMSRNIDWRQYTPTVTLEPTA